MSFNYAGYGFDSYDLSDKDLYDFVKKFDKKAYDAYIEDNPDLSEEEQIENISDCILMEYCFLAGYITDVIAQDLYNKHITGKEDRILDSFDNFIVCTPIQFSDEEKVKSKLIKNKNNLVELIKDYFPNAKITWGEVREASADWIEPEFIIE